MKAYEVALCLWSIRIHAKGMHQSYQLFILLALTTVNCRYSNKMSVAFQHTKKVWIMNK